jgi:phosphoinositide-3-kinase, regulatory subunit 4
VKLVCTHFFSACRVSEAVSGGLLLVIQVICSTVRYLRHPQSRITSLMMLSRMGALCNDTVILERIVPFVMLYIEDPIAVVRATSIRCLRTLLNSVTEISHVNANIFKEFIFPALDNVMNKDSEAIVRIAFAESIGRFAETSMRFLDAARFIHQNKCISAASGEAGAEADPAALTLVEGSYDASVAALHNHVSKWIRDLVLDGNVGMTYDVSKNEARRQHSNGSHSSVVKRAILEDVVRLCVFFGKQEKIMDLFAQLLAYVNHQVWRQLLLSLCVFPPGANRFDAGLGLGLGAQKRLLREDSSGLYLLGPVHHI